MPQLVRAFLDPEPEYDILYNGFTAILRVSDFTRIHYIVKYMLSTHRLAENGKKLTAYYAYLLANALADEIFTELASAIGRSPYERGKLEGTGQSFANLNAFIALHKDSADCIDGRVKSQLLVFLKQWSREWRHESVGSQFDDAVKALSGDRVMGIATEAGRHGRPQDLHQTRLWCQIRPSTL